MSHPGREPAEHVVDDTEERAAAVTAAWRHPQGEQAPARALAYGAPDGHGRFGVLGVDEQGLLLCHECGAWWSHLATHARARHGLTAADYRTAHGLGATTRLVGAGPRAAMRAAYAGHRDEHLARLEVARDIESARPLSRSHTGGTWAPQVRATRQATARARRGRDLTPTEITQLQADPVDLARWARHARELLTRPDVSTGSLARACDIAPATVSQRLRRYPG